MSTEAVDSKTLDRYECTACGYVYEPAKGDSLSKVAVGVPFEELADTWRCPVCGARKNRFSNVGPAGNPSGFKENLNYGFGFNAMTPGRKNLVIFGALAVAFLLFLSLYGLR
ncbi:MULTISPECIES: rubredoxin [unclassified Leptolyngbya]|uniref:rubredoxin n=1 Tax=unclassified Leptolyngbya TaxID=2650499 RepID=UPI001687C146|nr:MULTISPECIES: rubredoxin [unclassified Leptolyngbya]MBD1912444.1 rubredoxin [Leptolyngbya sp. FACHB-8]MBD2157945.1 rubredoxin [Leptolyngbya sp. FACHB-16]